MNYRSLMDLNSAIINGIGRLPEDIDIVVGIPRSGLLAANLVSLGLNLPMADLEGFCNGRVLSTGITRRVRKSQKASDEITHALVIDDSVKSGQSMAEARKKIEGAEVNAKVTYAAVFGSNSRHPNIDFIFEKVPLPRVFQWNVLHHDMLRDSCVDIDGVLCRDPTDEQNDDADNYVSFLRNAEPLFKPTLPIGKLVTSRLEKYRDLTEDWLARHEIEYNELVMLDLPDAETRRRLKAHGSFKADVYRKSNALLFIESEHHQAEEIAQKAGKPVLCTQNFELIEPQKASIAALTSSVRSFPKRLERKHTALTDINAARVFARRLLGERCYAIAKTLAGRGRQ